MDARCLPMAVEIAALGTFALVVLAIVVWIVWAFRKMPFTPVQSFLYGFNYVIARVLWRARIEGSFDLPPGQGAVIICNHRGPLDPSFIALATTRVVHWMVAKEFWPNPAVGWFLRTVRAIPVSRGGVDTAATKMAMRYTQEGGVVGLFPEGRINTSPDLLLLPGRPGAALIALRARVPVIPCYLEGSPYTPSALGPLITPAKTRLVIGQPIDLSPYYGREDDRKVLEELTLRFLKEIAKLAGQPDFKPQLAGRFYRPDLALRNGENGR